MTLRRYTRHHARSGAVPPPPSGSTYLPFELSTAASTKIVTSHHTPWYPISIDDQPSPTDWYDVNYMPIGPDYTQYGGRQRDRSYQYGGRPFGGDFRLTDARAEVAQAQSVGIDAFYIDAVGMAHKTTIDKLYTAAAEAGFKCMIGADLSGGTYASATPTTFANDAEQYVKHAAALKLGDGRALLGCFMAEGQSVSWWQQVKDILAARGAPVALALTCLSVTPVGTYASVAWAVGIWGGRIPPYTTPSATLSYANAAHGGGAKWMAPVAFQDVRPASIGNPFYWESVGHQTVRNCWDAANQQGDLVQLITWNDFAEGSQHSRSKDAGWNRLDHLAYHIHRFKYGSYPTIVRDSVIGNHRKQFYNSPTQYATPQPMPLRDGGAQPAVNQVEMEVWATATADLVTHVGANTYNQTVPAGYSFYQYPLAVGTVSVELKRGGVTVYSATSPHTVTNNPYVQDEEYKTFGGLR